MLLAGANLTLVCCELISAMDNVVTTVTWRCHNGGLERFYRQCENIADAALGLNHTWRARIDLELASQSQHLDIDTPIENVLVNTRGLQQILPRERSLRRLKKGEQQGILALAQGDRGRVRINELSAAPLKHPTVEPVAASLRIARPRSPSHFLSPQDGADAREQFPETKGLYDVIVRAEFKADNTVDFFGAMTGRYNHRYI